jgi:hypothetical protein
MCLVLCGGGEQLQRVLRHLGHEIHGNHTFVLCKQAYTKRKERKEKNNNKEGEKQQQEEEDQYTGQTQTGKQTEYKRKRVPETEPEIKFKRERERAGDTRSTAQEYLKRVQGHRVCTRVPEGIIPHVSTHTDAHTHTHTHTHLLRLHIADEILESLHLGGDVLRVTQTKRIFLSYSLRVRLRLRAR